MENKNISTQASYSPFEIYRWLENSRRGCWLIATLTFPAICIESLPHIYALDTSAQNPTTRFQYHWYDTAPLLSSFSMTVSHFRFLYFGTFSPYGSDLTVGKFSNSTDSVPEADTHSSGPHTRFYLYFDVFAADFCLEVTHSLVDELMYNG